MSSLPPVTTPARKATRPSTSAESLCSWSKNSPTNERRSYFLDLSTNVTNQDNTKVSPSNVSPNRRVSFESEILSSSSSRPIETFRLPTLSSLKKRRPVAVIKATTSQSNVSPSLSQIVTSCPTADHRSLLEQTKILERLRNVSTRSPIMEAKKQELEDLVNMKVVAVSKYDLLEISRESSNCVHDLASLFGDLSYRFDLSESKVKSRCPKMSPRRRRVKMRDIDEDGDDDGDKSENENDLVADLFPEDSRVQESRTFCTSTMTSFFRVAILEKKINSWNECIKNVLKMMQNLSQTNTTQIIALETLLESTSRNIDTAVKSCILWASKIVSTNCKIAANYFEFLPLDVLTRICSENRALEQLVNCHGMKNDVQPLEDVAKSVAAKNGQVAAFEFANFIFDAKDHHQDKDQRRDNDLNQDNDLNLEEFFGNLVFENQRSLLKLIFALNDEKSLFSPVKVSNIVPPIQSTKRSSLSTPKSGQNFCRQLDTSYWVTFWSEFKDELLKQTFVTKSESMAKDGLDTADVSFGFPILDAIKNFVIEGSSSATASSASSPIKFINEEALKALDCVYCELHRILTDKKWSISHRAALTAMDTFDGSSKTRAKDASANEKRAPNRDQSPANLSRGFLSPPKDAGSSSSPSSPLVEMSTKEDNLSPKSVTNDVLIVTNNVTSTKVGHHTLRSLESIVQFIQNCEKGENLTKETSYSLSLTLNTFLNWFNSQELVSPDGQSCTWDPLIAFVLIFGDFEKILNILKPVDHFQEVSKYIIDINEAKVRGNDKLRFLYTVNFDENISSSFPKKEYKMKSCPNNVNKWSENVAKNTVISTFDLIDIVHKHSRSRTKVKHHESTSSDIHLTSNCKSVSSSYLASKSASSSNLASKSILATDQKLQFLDLFFKSLINVIFDPKSHVKFSKSGASSFTREVIFLVELLESKINDSEDPRNDLDDPKSDSEDPRIDLSSKLESVSLLYQFISFIHCETNKSKRKRRGNKNTNRVSPESDLKVSTSSSPSQTSFNFKQSDHLVTDCKPCFNFPFM